MKHLRYLKYLIRHKWFVFLAGLKTGAPVWRLVIHDWSKFLPCEWLAYARWFYARPSRVDLERHNRWKEAFDRAWLHHQHTNPHHWQHWVLREDSGQTKLLEIPEHFVREMVADWAGAGRGITGKWEVVNWYEQNKTKIQLNDHSRHLVEQLLQPFVPPMAKTSFLWRKLS